VIAKILRKKSKAQMLDNFSEKLGVCGSGGVLDPEAPQ